MACGEATAHRPAAWSVGRCTRDAPTIVQRILSDRLTLTVQAMVVEKASRLELAFFERSESYDLLQRAADESACARTARSRPSSG